MSDEEEPNDPVQHVIWLQKQLENNSIEYEKDLLYELISKIHEMTFDFIPARNKVAEQIRTEFNKLKPEQRVEILNNNNNFHKYLSQISHDECVQTLIKKLLL